MHIKGWAVFIFLTGNFYFRDFPRAPQFLGHFFPGPVGEFTLFFKAELQKTKSISENLERERREIFPQSELRETDKKVSKYFFLTDDLMLES